MYKIKIPKQEMQDIVENYEDVVRDKITGTSRWSVNHQLIFKYNGKLYSTDYSVGATEYQDEQPWEYDDEVDAVEVEEYEKTVKDYRVIK